MTLSCSLFSAVYVSPVAVTLLMAPKSRTSYSPAAEPAHSLPQVAPRLVFRIHQHLDTNARQLPNHRRAKLLDKRVVVSKRGFAPLQPIDNRHNSISSSPMPLPTIETPFRNAVGTRHHCPTPIHIPQHGFPPTTHDPVQAVEGLEDIKANTKERKTKRTLNP